MCKGGRYRLRTPTLAIDEQKHAVHLDAGSVLDVLDNGGQGTPMIRVWVSGQVLTLFAVDLEERGEEITAHTAA